MMKRIFVINNYKDAELSQMKDLRESFKKSNTTVSDFLYKYTKDELKSLLTSTSPVDKIKLTLFLHSLFDDVDGSDYLYLIDGDKEFDQLNRIITARFIATHYEEVIKSGDIDKVLNNFIFSESPLDDSEYEFINCCIIFAQYRYNWLNSGGTESSDYRDAKTPLNHFNALSNSEFIQLNDEFEGGFEEFDLSVNPEYMKDNPPTIHATNAVYYDKANSRFMDIWLTLLTINQLTTELSTYVFSEIEPSQLIKALVNRIFKVVREGGKLSILNDEEVVQEVTEEQPAESKTDSQ